ncbi:MAG: CocE/NonD family hydrolase [Flavobacteriaceae bacterium]|nr:CocE/NonD family hydrolase [Flavobacteriaceae bacterium]
MKHILIILFVAISTCVVAQSKKDLPADYWFNYKQPVPENLSLQNQAAFEVFVRVLAVDFMQAHLDAAKEYEIKGASSKDIFHQNLAVAHFVLSNYKEALANIQLARKSNPTPEYLSPAMNLAEIYASTLSQQPNEKAKNFDATLKKSIQNYIKNLPTDFRKDLIFELKADFTPPFLEYNQQNIIRQLDLAKNSANQLNYQGVSSLLQNYANYRFRKQHSATVEKMLYAIDPSKVIETKVMIPMRDGILLSGLLYQDQNQKAKQPTIVSLSPYPSGTEASYGNIFAIHGYSYLYVDCRGKNESEGEFFPFENDAQDFYDIIDWVSKQDWNNGQVATSGGSYLGFTQWQNIRKAYRHPALKAMNPMVPVAFGVDFPKINNMFGSYLLQWAQSTIGKEFNRVLFSDFSFWMNTFYKHYKTNTPFYQLDSVAGFQNPYFQKWLSHPNHDQYWTDMMPKSSDYAALDIPVFSITGYYDGDQVGAYHYFDNHQKYASKEAADKHILLIGPYEHFAAQWAPGPNQFATVIEPAAQIPIYKYVIQWFDWVLKNKEKPAFIKDKITLYETGGAGWKGESSMQENVKKNVEFYLSPQQLSNAKNPKIMLMTQHRAKQEQRITYSEDIALPRDSATVFAEMNYFLEDSYVHSPYKLIFETEPFDRDNILADKISIQLSAHLNVPDADYMAQIYEIGPDGFHEAITYGTIRARFRNGNQPELVKPGELIQLNFAHVLINLKKLKKGHKLRLVIDYISSPYYQRNYGFGGDVSRETATSPRIIETQIITGGDNASKIVLPVTE